MFGDRNGASMPDENLLATMSKSDKKKSFLGKNVWQRMAIVSAGPVANFILAVVIFTFLLKQNGLNTVLPIVETVLPESAAFEDGLEKGDKILAIDGEEVVDFDAMRVVVMRSADKRLLFKIARGEEILLVKVTPKNQLRKDFFGDEVKMGMLGVTASEVFHRDLNFGQSFLEANVKTYETSISILQALGELITGRRSVKELGGPIKIAQYSGKTVNMGFDAVIWFIAMISINLGVMNLLPVPVLDGGHLFFYVIELVRGKPLPHKAQQIAFQVGLSVVLALMAFNTLNDVLALFR